jgi:uncharacterized protein
LIVIDVNILVYAYSPDSPHHGVCRNWIENVLGASEPIGLPLSVIHSFLRLLTFPHVVATPQSIETVINRVDEWLTVPIVAVLNPGPRYWAILRRLLIEKRISGNLIYDAHIAALAIENDASVCTADHDFQRFDELTIINPLS